MFELNKGVFSTQVKAGILGALAATLLVACGAERAPVETAAPDSVAAASSPSTVADASGDMPEVVVSARRGRG